MSRGIWKAPHNDLEKIVQQKCVKLYRLAGCHVFSLSQARPTRQTEGIPDLWVMAPTVGAAWWHEVKSASGKQSKAQTDFQVLCLNSVVQYVVGGLAEATKQLIKVGLATDDGGLFVLTPKRSAS